MLARNPRGRGKDARGQMMLPFGKRKRKGPSRAEMRETKENAERLCRQAYAVLSNHPVLFGHGDIEHHKREIWHYVELFRKERLTYGKAKSAIGEATSVLDEAGVKYRL